MDTIVDGLKSLLGKQHITLPSSFTEVRSIIYTSITENPAHAFIEVFLIVFMAYILLVKRAYDPAKKGYGGRGLPELTEREREELIAEWEPEPLVKSIDGQTAAPKKVAHYIIERYVDGPQGVRVKIENRDEPCVTFGTQDFLGLGGEKSVRAVAEATLEKYTVGSCGPRGFYGTTLAHLELEDSLAHFMSADESITYSDATATIASAVPAFAKRGDVLLIDSGANFGIQIGASLSRSKIVYWNHNDIADLEKKLEAVADSDARKRDVSLEQRRFIVVEGLYANTGDLCPLREVQRLAAKYRWRIIVDDSLGFGVLGREGRGITEHAGLTMRDVDVLVGSLATTLGSVGGFCVGSRQVVDHQRLSGAGYCFSASAPPFLCATASAALRELQKGGEDKLKMLRAKCRALQEKLTQEVSAFSMLSHEESPLKHLVLLYGPIARTRALIGASNPNNPATRMLSPTTQKVSDPDARMAQARLEEEVTLDRIIVACAARGVLLSRTHSLPQEAFHHAPSLKVYLTLRHAQEDMELLVKTLKAVTEEMELHI